LLIQEIKKTKIKENPFILDLVLKVRFDPEKTIEEFCQWHINFLESLSQVG